MACGLTVSADELPKLQEILDQEAKNQNLESAAKQVKILDGDIDLSEINPEMIQELSVLGPFGTNNPKPVFHIGDMSLKMQSRWETEIT